MALNNLIFEDSLVWANATAANTAKTLDVPVPPRSTQNGLASLVTIYNPSAVTDLTVTVQVHEKFATGGDKYAPYMVLSVPKGTAQSLRVEGWPAGANGRLSISNDAISDAFTAEVRVREV